MLAFFPASAFRFSFGDPAVVSDGVVDPLGGVFVLLLTKLSIRPAHRRPPLALRPGEIRAAGIRM